MIVTDAIMIYIYTIKIERSKYFSENSLQNQHIELKIEYPSPNPPLLLQRGRGRDIPPACKLYVQIVIVYHSLKVVFHVGR